MGRQRGTPRRLVTAAVGKERKGGGEEREGDRVQQAPRPHGRHARRHHRTGPHTHTHTHTHQEPRSGDSLHFVSRLLLLPHTRTHHGGTASRTRAGTHPSTRTRHQPVCTRGHAAAREGAPLVRHQSEREKKKDVYRELREFRIGVGDPSAHARQHPVAAVQRSTQPDDTRRASPLTQPARSAFLLMPRTAQCGGVGCCSTQTRREKEGGSTRTPAQQRWRQGNLKKKSE